LLRTPEAMHADIDAMQDAASGFFAMPEDVKQGLGEFTVVSGKVVGYRNSGAMDTEFLEMHVFNDLQPCPSPPLPSAEFSDVVVPLYCGLGAIARDLLTAMAEHINIAPEALIDNIDPAHPSELEEGDLTASVLRICSYHCENQEEPQSQKGGADTVCGRVAREAGVLFDEHTDSTFITVALISKVPGL